MKEFTIISHRGFSSRAPENTVAAFDLAIDSGYCNIELDVQLTSDGVPVVIHDGMLERTTNGIGLVKKHSWADLQQLDAGSWFDTQYSNQKISRLDDILARYASKAHLHIELKSDEEELVPKVITLLQSSGLDGAAGNFYDIPGITITSFIESQLERSIKLLPSVAHAWLVEEINNLSIDVAVSKGFAQICPRAVHTTEASIRAAVSKGLDVRGQGVKTDADIELFYLGGASGATTNWPDKAQVVLKHLTNLD